MADQHAFDVEFRGITKRFGDLAAVDNVSLQVRKGEFLSLLGPSGSGKTTLLQLMGGALRPADGPAVDAIVERIGKKNYGLRTLVHEVVRSDLFLNK